MSCTGNFDFTGLGIGICHQPINLEAHLKRMLFTETQIIWVKESINKTVEYSWFEIESINEFPLNHDYGFKKDGGCKKGSKYNLLISFAHSDKTNKFTGKQSSRILLIKN